MYVKALQPVSLTFSDASNNFRLDQQVPFRVLPLWVAQQAAFGRLWNAGIVQVATDTGFANVITSIPPSETGGGSSGPTDWNDITSKPAVIAAGADQPTARAAISVMSSTEVSSAITTAVNTSSATAVHIAGTETITGAKNFTGILTKDGQAVVITTDPRLSGGGGTTTTVVTRDIEWGYCQSELAHGSYAGFDTLTKIQQVLQGIKDIGAKYVRVAAWWNVIEPVKDGGYTWTGMDQFFDQVGDYGLIPLLAITSPAPTGATITDYGELCGAIAARYGSAGTGQLKHYEIWNEENNTGPAAPFNTGSTPFGPATYTSLLIAASTAIRAADTEAFILLGGLMSTVDFSTTDILPSTFLQGVIDNGGGPYFDAFNVHWYSGAVDFSGWLEPSADHPVYIDMTTCRQKLIDNDMADKQFWITEMGQPITGTEADPLIRSNWMIEQIELILQLDFVDVWFLYNYKDAPGLADDQKFGVVDSNLVKYQPLWDTLDNINAVTPKIPQGSVTWDRLKTTGTPSSTTFVKVAADGSLSAATPAGGGTGNVTGQSSSVDGEIALFSGTGGQTIKRATQTGILKGSSGVLGTATAGTDYAPPTSGTSVLKGNGSGGFSAAVAGTDYTTPSSTESPTNKTFNATGTGNSITNLAVSNFNAAAIVTAAETIGANNNDTTLPTSAAVKAYADSVSGGAGAVQVYTQTFGDGTVGPFDINHGLNTYEVMALVREVGGNREDHDITVQRPSSNVVRLIPDTIIASDTRRVTLFCAVGVGDVTPPAAPGFTFVSKSANSITAAIAASATATSYKYYQGGVLKGIITAPGNVTFTGLSPNTAYSNLTATALDAEGNESAATTLPPTTTDASLPVAFGAVGGTTTDTGTQAVFGNTTPITVVSGDNCLLAMVAITILTSFNMASFTSFTVASDLSGSLTLVPNSFSYAGTGGSNGGSNYGIAWFSKIGAGVVSGAQTITTSINTGSPWGNCMTVPLSYANVGSIGTPVRGGAGSGSISLTIPSSTDGMVVAGFVGLQANAITGNGSSHKSLNPGSNRASILVQDHAGATSVTSTANNGGNLWGGSALPLVKAP